MSLQKSKHKSSTFQGDKMFKSIYKRANSMITKIFWNTKFSLMRNDMT